MRVSNDENAVFVSGTLGGAPELSHSLYGEDFIIGYSHTYS